MAKTKRFRSRIANPTVLRRAGYERSPVPSAESADEFWQRRVEIDGKALFYVNISIYHFPEDALGDRAGISAQLRRSGFVFNVEPIDDGEMTISDAEAFLAGVFQRLGCKAAG